MKFLNELLGFAVLTGPLWLILILLPIAIWIAVKVAKRFKFGGTRLAVGVLAFGVVFFVLFADEIAGHVYFNYLCATEAGVKVHQTVELPAEYWDERGRPRFFNQYGYLDRDFSAKRIDMGEGRVVRYSSIFSIDKDLSRVVDKDNHALLGEVTTFRFWGGWIRRNFSPSNTANDCKFIYDSNFSRDFYGRLFVPTHPIK